MEGWGPPDLPLDFDVESKSVLKRLPRAHAALAELKGVAASIPNQLVLINTLVLQEAKDSSAVENIITTHDDLYKAQLQLSSFHSSTAKEVQNYAAAMKRGFELIRERDVLTNHVVREIQETLEGNNAGFRKVPGTTLKNSRTGEVVYVPPQEADEIERLMRNLEGFINDDGLSDLDPLVKMAIVHFQFESIHPFYDGNGRTGRIINILYLILQDLLRLPILYLSSYVIRDKARYYRALQEVRTNGDWEAWLLYMIEAVEVTARETIALIADIKALMQDLKLQLRDRYKFYSQDLLNNLFKHPYTKIEFVVHDLRVSRITAANYLNTLAKDGVLQKSKLGTSNYYVNQSLVRLLAAR